MNGFVNVLKPVGATASDVVVCVKHALKEKSGHLGTLDPGASGVLPVAVGKATRLFDFLTDKVKYYRAFFTFGKTTDTLDSYGAVTGKGTVPAEEELIAACEKLTGAIWQTPPAYSALSVGGVKAYKLARSGVDVQLKQRKVTVFELKLLRRQCEDTFVFDVKCSAGTYIRSIARDIASLCGTVAYMSGLIRLQSGCFTIENAYTLDEVRSLGEKCLLDVTYPLSDVESCVLPDNLYDDLDFGRKIACPFEHGYRKIYCMGQLFGLAKNDNGILKLQYYLKNLQEN